MVVEGSVVNGVWVDGPAAAQTAGDEPSTAAAEPAGVVLGEEESYDTAFNLMKTREFDRSIAAFRELLDNYPKGDLAPNSQYWLGELYLQKDRLEEARLQFESVVDKYPAHQKVPDSIYKLGVVSHRKGRVQRALEYFDDLLNRYPGAPAAGLAKSYAADLR